PTQCRRRASDAVRTEVLQEPLALRDQAFLRLDAAPCYTAAMPAASDDRIYSDEEARAIFERALELDAKQSSQGLCHEELLAAAREVGLSDATVEKAIEEMTLARAAGQARAAIIERRR